MQITLTNLIFDENMNESRPFRKFPRVKDQT